MNSVDRNPVRLVPLLFNVSGYVIAIHLVEWGFYHLRHNSEADPTYNLTGTIVRDVIYILTLLVVTSRLQSNGFKVIAFSSIIGTIVIVCYRIVESYFYLTLIFLDFGFWLLTFAILFGTTFSSAAICRTLYLIIFGWRKPLD